MESLIVYGSKLDHDTTVLILFIWLSFVVLFDWRFYKDKLNNVSTLLICLTQIILPIIGFVYFDNLILLTIGNCLLLLGMTIYKTNLRSHFIIPMICGNYFLCLGLIQKILSQLYMCSSPHTSSGISECIEKIVEINGNALSCAVIFIVTIIVEILLVSHEYIELNRSVWLLWLLSILMTFTLFVYSSMFYFYLGSYY